MRKVVFERTKNRTKINGKGELWMSLQKACLLELDEKKRRNNHDRGVGEDARDGDLDVSILFTIYVYKIELVLMYEGASMLRIAFLNEAPE